MDKNIPGLFNLMVENFPDLVWAKDLEGKYIYCNKAHEEFLGVEYSGEAIGKDDAYFFEREKIKFPSVNGRITFGDLCRNSDERVIAERKPIRSQEYGYLRGNMVYYDINKAPIFDSSGNFTGTVGSGRDVTKEKLFELALAESETRYRALLEANPDLMFLFNSDGVYIGWSGDKQKLISEPQYFMNKSVKEVLPPEVAERTLANINRLRESDEMQVLRYKLMINGEEKHFESRMVRCGSEYFLTIIREISDQVKYETELKEAKLKAEESNKMKTVFLQNMSHELRTPLIGILGYSEIMSESTEDKTFASMAETINKAGHRLLETFDSLLSIARIESNKQELQFSMVDVRKLIHQNLEILNPMILAHNVKVEIETQKNLIIRQDYHIINSIIMNLLSNAVKFTSQGVIRITALSREEAESKIFVLTVEDTGIGIKDEDRELIFDAFRQGSEGYDRAFEGVGLGLTITKKYVELLGGTINIESSFGTGSKFTVKLPEAVDTKNTNDAPVVFPTILVIDDDPLMHDLTERIFCGRATVYGALNFSEACELLKLNSYSLIIIDINLGTGENGLDILHRIKKNPELSTIPVAAVTAYAMAGDKESLLKAGFDYYLSKPFKKKDIVAILEDAILK